MSDWKIGLGARRKVAAKWVGEASPEVEEPTISATPRLTVLVDGDLVAYRCAAATEGTYYQWEDKEFKYHRDALAYVLEHKKKWPAGLTEAAKKTLARKLIEKKTNPEPIENAYYNMQKIFRKARRHFSSYDVEFKVYLTHDVLFRDEVSPTYKKSREGLKRPTNLKGCKAWLEKKYAAVTIEGYEADDLMAIAHKMDPDAVIMSLDKDLKQLAGHHYDFITDVTVTVTPEEARFNFWQQVLVGDKTDDIVGLFGVGPKTSATILKPVWGKGDRAHYDVCLQEYINREPKEDGESDEEFYMRMIQHIGKNCRLLYLVREIGVMWDVPEEPDGKIVKGDVEMFEFKLKDEAEFSMPMEIYEEITRITARKLADEVDHVVMKEFI